jgi:hypothetical protein
MISEEGRLEDRVMLDEVVKINIRGYTSKRVTESLWSKTTHQCTKTAHAVASGNVPER